MSFLLHAQKCAEVKIFAVNPSPRTGDALLQDRRERIRKVRLVVFHPTPRCARIFLSRASTGIALDGQKELIALTPKGAGSNQDEVPTLSGWQSDAKTRAHSESFRETN